jgi:Ca-activated chloride channel family protein
MFRLEHPPYLWLLLLVPLVVGLFVWYWRRRRTALDRFADRELIDYIAPGLNRRLPWTKFILLATSLPLLILALANPQWSAQREEVQRRGIDLIIALDISNSMRAEDVKPSRMDRARYFTTTLIDELAGNNIGVELFTCTAVMAAPLTTDYNFVKSVVSTAAPYQISAQGTNLAEAITVAEAAFDEESANHRALIIVSDGEDHDGSAASAAASAYDAGLLVYTVGVGKSSGSLMPITLNNGRSDYIREPGGGPATTSADLATLENIAESGGGSYFPLSGDSENLAQALRAQVDRIEKLEFETQSFSSYDSYFYWFLAPGVLLLLIEFSIGWKEKSKVEGLRPEL